MTARGVVTLLVIGNLSGVFIGYTCGTASTDPEPKTFAHRPCVEIGGESMSRGECRKMRTTAAMERIANAAELMVAGSLVPVGDHDVRSQLDTLRCDDWNHEGWRCLQ